MIGRYRGLVSLMGKNRNTKVAEKFYNKNDFLTKRINYDNIDLITPYYPINITHSTYGGFLKAILLNNNVPQTSFILDGYFNHKFNNKVELPEIIFDAAFKLDVTNRDLIKIPEKSIILLSPNNEPDVLTTKFTLDFCEEKKIDVKYYYSADEYEEILKNHFTSL